MNTAARDLFSLAIFSLPISFQWSVLSALLLPADVLRFVTVSEKTLHLSWIVGLGALMAMVTQPLAGAWSDRRAERRGSRRPLILLGAVVNALGLGGMAVADHLHAYVVAFLIMDVASNLAIAAYHGLWRDRMPARQNGVLSGWIGFFSLLGNVLGLWFGGMLSAVSRHSIYLMLMIVFTAGALFTVYLGRDTPLPIADSPHHPFRFPRFWNGWRQHPDFCLACLHRLIVLLGFNLVIVYLAYYLKDVLGMADYVRATGTLGAVVMLVAMASSLLAGGLSDRFSRKKPLIGAGIVMGLAVGAIATSHAFAGLLAAGAVFGLAYGIFMAADLALALDVLPAQATAARDIAIWHVTYQLARTLAPALGGLLVYVATVLGHDRFGYSSIFLLAAACFWWGSALVFRIASVR